jgi:hypothetical protein
MGPEPMGQELLRQEPRETRPAFGAWEQPQVPGPGAGQDGVGSPAQLRAGVPPAR